MKLSFFRTALAVLGLAFVSILFTACYKSNNSMSNNNSAPVAALMAFNLATDKAVSITLSGDLVTDQPLPFTSYTGNYLNVYAGPRLIQSIDYNSKNVLDSSTFNFTAQKYYSLFVTGSNGHYRNVIANDNFDSLNTMQAYIRYVNAIPDSSSPTVTITANGSNVVNSNASYASVSNFVAVAPGTVSIQVSNGEAINKTRSITLEQQKAYTVLLAGVPGSTGNDSLQIKYVVNGMFSQSAHKAGSTVGSAGSN